MQTILVVGAGPTGLTAAATLLRHGIRARVIDRAVEPPADRSRAIVLQARTLELFRDLGIDEAILRDARVVDAATVVLPSGRRGALRILPAWIASRFNRITTLPQDETERHLQSLLDAAGLTVERGVVLEAIEQPSASSRGTKHPAIAMLRHADGSLERCSVDWIIGADGAHSAVRSAAGIDFPGETYRDEALLGDVDLEWSLPDSDVAIMPNSMGFLLAFPLPGVHRFRIIMIRPAEAAPEARDLSLAEFTRALREMSPDSLQPGGPRVASARWLTRYRLHRRGVKTYRAGRAFLAGDAAHIHSPVGAQGMNTGIQDAYNLGWKLGLVAAGDAPEWILDSYHLERHPVGELLLRRTDQLFGLLARGGWLPRLLRRLLPGIGVRLLGWPLVGKRIAGFISETRIRYAHSPLATDGPGAAELPRGAPRAGDRLADAELADGQWLHDRLRGPLHWLLVIPPRRNSSSSANGTEVAESDRELLERAAATLEDAVALNYPHTVRVHRPLAGDAALATFAAEGGALYLVRPDKHIGWRGTLDDAPAALQMLAERLIHSPRAE